eukprot:259087-Pleurochrysis_carterae.AAC.2
MQPLRELQACGDIARIARKAIQGAALVAAPACFGRQLVPAACTSLPRPDAGSRFPTLAASFFSANAWRFGLQAATHFKRRADGMLEPCRAGERGAVAMTIMQARPNSLDLPRRQRH